MFLSLSSKAALAWHLGHRRLKCCINTGILKVRIRASFEEITFISLE